MHSFTLQEQKEIDEKELHQTILQRKFELSQWLEEDIKAQRGILDALEAEIEHIEGKGRLRGRRDDPQL